MKGEDARLARRVRSEIIRRELITQKLEVVVLHGVAYLSGELTCSRAHRIYDYKKEFEIIENILLTINGIRGVDNRIKWVSL
jgi:hypothetical protein